MLQILYHHPLLSKSSCVPSAKSTVFHVLFLLVANHGELYMQTIFTGDWGFILLLPEVLFFALHDSALSVQLLLSCSHRAVQSSYSNGLWLMLLIWGAWPKSQKDTMLFLPLIKKIFFCLGRVYLEDSGEKCQNKVSREIRRGLSFLKLCFK